MVSGHQLPAFTAASFATTTTSRPLTPPMEDLLRQLPKFDAVSRKELFERVEMDPKDFDEAFNALYEGLYVVRNGQNKYLRIGDATEDQAEARRIILERLVSNFGIVSAEGLARMTKHEFRMHEIRDYLSGNLCRCGTYSAVIEAVQDVVAHIRSAETSSRA